MIIKATTIILSLIVCSCAPLPTPDPTIPEPTLTSFVRQPIPVGPQVGGVFSGLLDGDELVTIRIHDENGDEVLYGTHSGNGPWEVIAANIVTGTQYIVSVEADGYTSQPVTYTIGIDAPGRNVMEITSKLDFYFLPVSK